MDESLTRKVEKKAQERHERKQAIHERKQAIIDGHLRSVSASSRFGIIDPEGWKAKEVARCKEDAAIFGALGRLQADSSKAEVKHAVEAEEDAKIFMAINIKIAKAESLKKMYGKPGRLARWLGLGSSIS
jgi:hypothetical protein